MHKLIPRYLSEAQVFNLGGGWLYRENSDFGPFYKTIDFLNKHYPDLCLMIEPGSTLSRRFGSLEFSVIDVFRSSGVNFATVDASCNHLPEVYEYRPGKHQELAQEDLKGEHEYILAGLTCLRGDNFGTYKFNKPLKVGDRLRFIDCGSYSVVKMNDWNGVRQADLYWVKADGDLELVKRYGYESFRHRWM
jgi:carboxynorspermidine decarboxylase